MAWENYSSLESNLKFCMLHLKCEYAIQDAGSLLIVQTTVNKQQIYSPCMTHTNDTFMQRCRLCLCLIVVCTNFQGASLGATFNSTVPQTVCYTLACTHIHCLSLLTSMNLPNDSVVTILWLLLKMRLIQTKYQGAFIHMELVLIQEESRLMVTGKFISMNKFAKYVY